MCYDSCKAHFLFVSLIYFHFLTWNLWFYCIIIRQLLLFKLTILIAWIRAALKLSITKAYSTAWNEESIVFDNTDKRKENTSTNFTVLELKLEKLGPQTRREERSKGSFKSSAKRQYQSRLWTQHCKQWLHLQGCYMHAYSACN